MTQGPKTFTPRMAQTTLLVAAGYSDVQIARVMGVTLKTAKDHVARARAYLGAVNRAHLVAIAFRRGLIR